MIPALIYLAILASPADTCSAAEYAYYELRGWDAYECDGDKAHAPDANLTFPQLKTTEE